MKAQTRDRILVVDDNVAIHDDFRKILGDANAHTAEFEAMAAEIFGGKSSTANDDSFELDSAFQGQEALELVRAALGENRPYSMAFVDLRMPPGWDGIETIGEIWKIDPQLQIVICSAYSDYSWTEITKRLGKSDNLVILKKPFDNIEVLQLAHALTRKWELARTVGRQIDNLDQAVRARTAELEVANVRLQEEMAERSRAQEQFVKAFGASPIPMSIQTLNEQRYVDVNEAFLKMIGYSREEVVGKLCAEVPAYANNDDQRKFFEQLEKVGSIKAFELKLRTKSGVARTAVAAAELFEMGIEPYALLIVQDVTERLTLEEQLRHAQKLEAVGKLASGVAHDFNNLLTIIEGHVTMAMSNKDLPPAVQDSLNETARAAVRAASLTQQLLTFSRKHTVQHRTLDLNAVLSDMRNMIGRLIGEQIDLTWRFASEPVWLHADEGNLQQIVMNLAVNSRDAMPGGGKLVIETSLVSIDPQSATRHPDARPGEFVCLRVTDTGCGMADEVLAHVFEPFFTTKDVGKGTGLGLATVYGIVKQHTGWIEVESKVNAGAIFTVFLPRGSAPTVKAPAQSVTRKTTQGNETILIVEDEDQLRSLVKQILTACGYNVLEAADGHHAINVWTENASNVHLLLTDIVMPNGVNGWALARTLQKRNPHLKVVYTSGYNPETAMANGEGPEGCVNYIQKPYSPTKLVEFIRTCLDNEAAVAMH